LISGRKIGEGLNIKSNVQENLQELSTFTKKRKGNYGGNWPRSVIQILLVLESQES